MQGTLILCFIIEGNIFRSVENVNLSTVIAFKENGVKHHFLENYENIIIAGDSKTLQLLFFKKLFILIQKRIDKSF
jgi:hypothetical protein